MKNSRHFAFDNYINTLNFARTFRIPTFRFPAFRLSALLILSLCLLCGCSQKNENVNKPANDVQMSSSQTSSASTSETEEVAAYPYADIPLNVIDDNYRNYYEIFVYSFYDSDGDGVGDLNGVDEQLDYIKDMGFNGIWLMPVMPSTTYHKYDVTDYMNIDPEYGTLDDMKKLVGDAHKNDINVIIDFVMNHSSSKNPWFIKAVEELKEIEANMDSDDFYENGGSDNIGSLDEKGNFIFSAGVSQFNREATYYHFARKKVNSTYYKVPGTDSWYYEGSFWSEMPDLNYQSGYLRNEFMDIARFWVQDMGVDGFRMDATMHFEEGDTEFNVEVMNWIYEYCKSLKPDFYMVSEVWSSENTIKDYYKSQTDSMFNFDLGGPEGKIIKTALGKQKMSSFVEALKTYENDFGSSYKDYIDAPFITNHDMGRVCNALQSDEDAMKFAGGLLLSLKGSPYVYYGEEIGMKSKGNKDENKRLPMIWENTEDSSSAGETTASSAGETTPGTTPGTSTGMTKGPVDADKGITQSFPSVKEQLDDPDSILNYYKRALLIRNQNPEIARGVVDIIDALTGDNHAFMVKTYNDSKVGIAYNNSVDESFEMDLSLCPMNNVKVVGYLTTDNSIVELKDGKITLPPRSIVYVKEE